MLPQKGRLTKGDPLVSKEIQVGEIQELTHIHAPALIDSCSFPKTLEVSKKSKVGW